MMTNDDEILYTCDSNTQHVFTLDVAGHSIRSIWAICQVHRLCEKHFHRNYKLQVVDVYQYPQAAEYENVVATPTLVKHLPTPVNKYIGNSIDIENLITNRT